MTELIREGWCIRKQRQAGGTAASLCSRSLALRRARSVAAQFCSASRYLCVLTTVPCRAVA
jgi:hypothetical protein